MRKALVTGGCGFIGSHVVDELVDRGWKVVVLDNFSVGETKNMRNDVTYFVGDIRDEAKVRMVLRDVDVIFHFAYDATECKSIFSPVLDTDINLRGGMILLKEAINAGVRKFVFPSSVLAYGVPQELPMKEDHRLTPDDPYSVSKVAFESYLRVYHELGVIDPYIIRFNNTYGPRLRLDNPYKGVTQIFIKKALRGEDLTIFGDGEQTRAFTYVEDIKRVIVDLVDHDELINKPINIGSDFVHSVNELADTIIEETNSEANVINLPKRQKDIDHAYCDVKLMQKTFAYKCQTNLKEGIAKTVAWAIKQPDDDFQYNWPVEIPCLLEDIYKEEKI